MRPLTPLRPLFLAALMACGLSAQNFVVNGSFENVRTGGCQFNLQNDVFTASVDNATAFGAADELDLLRNAQGCAYGSTAINGITKVGLHTRIVSGPTDAFSLSLTAPLEVGGSYSLSFYVEPEFQFDPDLGAVEIGLSNDESSFGTKIFSGSGSPAGVWTKLSHTFVAPVAATFLTVRNDFRQKSWNFVDDFVLQRGPGCVVRNGSGINELGFSCLSAPLLGGNWATNVPTNPTTTSAYLALGVTALPGVRLFSGELLVDAQIVIPGTGTFSFNLPPTPSLQGMALYAQGLRLDNPVSGATLVFLNALDVTLGL